MGIAIDISGQRFGRLVAVKDIGRNARGNVLWEATCDCGKSIKTQAYPLRSGHTRSCGCLRIDQLKERVIHGDNRKSGKAPEHMLWYHLRGRCFNPKDKSFANYGGRGITICKEWQASYEAFLRGVGRRPSNLHSLDRIDNNGNYEPGNVRWATMTEQARNTRRNRQITAFGETKPMAAWAEQYGMSAGLFKARMDRFGMTPEQALTKVLHKRSSAKTADSYDTAAMKTATSKAVDAPPTTRAPVA